MLAIDIVYFIAFCIFLTGASLSFRGIKEKYSLWIMATGVLIDFFATILPSTGFKSLAIGIEGSAELITGIILEVLVWNLFLGAVFVRLMGKFSFFYIIITVIKVSWFIDLILIIHGVYGL